ncbi:hypothetical protein FXO37_15321 [Capsicum annuum]|nr:hypothetical protein FXO37_15321 [Capsicum annuum]
MGDPRLIWSRDKMISSSVQEELIKPRDGADEARGCLGVTLVGTEKETSDRHPKIGQGALIGASVTILGNIKVGEGAMIGADSLVMKDVPLHSMVTGIPAKVIGYVDDQDPSLNMKRVMF